MFLSFYFGILCRIQTCNSQIYYWRSDRSTTGSFTRIIFHCKSETWTSVTHIKNSCEPLERGLNPDSQPEPLSHWCSALHLSFVLFEQKHHDKWALSSDDPRKKWHLDHWATGFSSASCVTDWNSHNTLQTQKTSTTPHKPRVMLVRRLVSVCN